ncbi:MAG: PLP-dependent aminotransferase family protein [Pseudomonadota bacterium]|nr:PLP-dependent aminotransferase family protein [Pseudomonadota bacterium]
MKLESPWQPRLAEGAGTASVRLVRAVSEDIAAGHLPAGARLPAHRDLAWRLGIAVGTVTRAYSELERCGLVGAVRGQGTFVAGGPGPAAQVVDLSMNVPPVAVGDGLLRASLRDIARGADATGFCSYLPAIGTAVRRGLLAGYLSEQGTGTPLDPARLMICNGAQHALAVALALACPRGTMLVTECVTYPGVLALARQSGIPVRGVDVDAEGMEPGSLDRLLASRAAPAAVYITPDLHNPTGRTMGEARRREIVRICASRKALIVEDAVYSGLCVAAGTRLESLAPDRVLHVGGLSKTVSPGLRIGALLVPQAMWETAVAAFQAGCTTSAPLNCMVMERWIVDGTARAVRDHLRIEARERCRLAAERLGIAMPAVPAFHVWLETPETAARALEAAAAREGVILTPPESMRADPMSTVCGVRLCLGGPDRPGLEDALSRLARLLPREPIPVPMVI